EANCLSRRAPRPRHRYRLPVLRSGSLLVSADCLPGTPCATPVTWRCRRRPEPDREVSSAVGDRGQVHITTSKSIEMWREVGASGLDNNRVLGRLRALDQPPVWNYDWLFVSVHFDGWLD